ncbi:MAG: EamA family transporter [Halodesulfurarchaeum sp.]
MAALEAVGMATLAAGIWSLSMVVSKLGLESGGTSLQVSVIVAGTDVAVYLVILSVMGQLGSMTQIPAFGLGAFALAGVFGTALGRFASFAGIRRVGASINSAVISARPLFATALAFVFIDEAVSLQVVGGIVVLVVGLAVLSISRGGDIRGWRPVELLFPLAAGGAFAAADVLRRFGLTETRATTLQGVALNEMAGLVLLVAYLVLAKRDALQDVSTRTYGLFFASGLLNAASFFTFFTALNLGPVAIGSSLIATTPLFTAVFAYFLLGDLERITPGVVAGALLVVAGAIAITLG